MTKKFIHTAKEINGPKCKSEFIIPDVFTESPNLIGLKTGNMYEAGHVVYTGVDLTVTEVLEKAEKLKPLGFLKRRKAKKTIEKYLIQLKDIKISSKVILTDNGDLLKIEKK